jgi:hypothetical protein
MIDLKITAQQTAAYLGNSALQNLSESLNGVLDDEISLLIVNALNKLPKAILLNSTIMNQVSKKLLIGLKEDFAGVSRSSLKNLGWGLLTSIIVDAVADGAEAGMRSQGVTDSTYIVVVRYWVTLIVSDSLNARSGPAGVIANSIAVSIGAISDQSKGLAMDIRGEQASLSQLNSLRIKAQDVAAQAVARGDYKTAARIRTALARTQP